MAIAYGGRVASNKGATAVASFGSGALTGAVAAGSLILVSVACSNVGDTTNLKSVTDTQGNTYVSGGFTVDGGQNTLAACWYCVNSAHALSTADSVTVTLNSALLGSGETWKVAVDYATGEATSSVTDGEQSKNSQTGATWNTGTGITTTNANDLLWVVFGINQGEPAAIVNADCAPNSGWTLQAAIINGGNNGDSLRTGYNIVSATGTYFGGGTCTTASNGASALIIAFKAAAGGGGTNWNQSLTDKQSGTESSVQNPTKLAADSSSGTDFTGKTATKPATDAQSGVDSSTRAPQKALGDAQSGQDRFTKATQAVLLDSQSALDALSHLWSAHLLMVEAVSGLDTVQKAVLAPILDHFSETDSVTESNQLLSGQNWSKTLTDSFSETDLVASWTLLKLLGDAYAATDARLSRVGRPLYDVSSGHDSLTKTVLAVLSDAGVLSESQHKQIQAALVDVTSAVDKLTAGKVLLLTLLDQASLLDTPMETYTKAQWGLLGLITSLVASSLGMTITFTNSTALAASTTLLAGALAMVFSIPF